MKKLVHLGLAALIVAGFTAPAAAAAPGHFSDSAISVSYADLNIHNAAGAKVLYARLKQASETVCKLDSYRELGSLARVADAKACFAETLDEAVAEVSSAALSRIHST